MTSLIYIAVGAMMVAPMTAWAQSSDPLQNIDIARELAVARVSGAGSDTALAGSLATWSEQLLPGPGSPYGDIQTSPAFINERYWRTALDTLNRSSGHVATSEQALRALAWDLGLTKSRPRKDLAFADLASADMTRLAPKHDTPLIITALVKAGIDADIFSAALVAATESHSTVAASYAVAAQIIRDRARRYSPTAWKRLGIRNDIVDRLVAIEAADDFEDRDRRYLAALAGREMNRRRAGRTGAHGVRELPTPFRVARVAAAYRDGQGYFSDAPCHADGEPRAGVASEQAPGDERPLCFAGASDKAVYRWYADELWNQAHHARITYAHTSWIPAMFEALLDVILVIDFATAAGFAESLLADELVEARVIGEEAGEETFSRQNNPSCRIR